MRGTATSQACTVRTQAWCSDCLPKLSWRSGLWYSDHPSFVTTAVVIRNRVVHLVIAGLLIAVFAVSCQSAQPGTPDGNSAGQAGPVMSLAVDAMDGSLLKA